MAIMKQEMPKSILLFALVAASSMFSIVESKPARSPGGYKGGKSQQSSGTANGPIKCLLWLRGTHFTDGTSLHEWICSFDDPNRSSAFGVHKDKVVVGAGDDDIQDYLYAHGAESGKTVMVLSEANFDDGNVIVATEQVLGLEENDSHPSTETRGGGGRAPTKGTLDTLVVRVNALDNSPPKAKKLSKDIFKDKVCLKKQYAACSYDKLQIQEYIPGDGISDVPTIANAPGVVDVFVDEYADGGSSYDIEHYAKIEAQNLFNVTDLESLFDLVMFCLPPGTGSWIAYAYLGREDSYYNDYWCQMISAQMHEVGHSIGLHHSGEAYYGYWFDEYADMSGYMGYGHFGDDTPAMCFNPAKNWQLGWYDDKQLEIFLDTDLSSEPTSYILNGVVDYGDITDGAYVVLKIGDFYLGFNKATGFNEGTQEASNQVTVQEKLGSPTSSTFSKLHAKLSVGGTADVEISASILLRVRYSQNTNNKDAVVELSYDTPAPTESPSESPTEAPTVCDNSLLQIKLQEDTYGVETSIAVFSLNDDNGDLDSLAYFQAGYQSHKLHNIPLCLESDRCYLFAIHDSYGDGLTEYGGYFDLLLEGKTIYKSDGDFGSYDSRIFCTGDHICKDNTKIRFSKKKKKCQKFVKGKFSQKQKKCNRFEKGDFVYNHCPETCGRGAKVGPCTWMRNKEEEMEEIVLDELGYTKAPTYGPTTYSAYPT